MARAYHMLYATLSPQEKAKQDRRIGSAIKRGMPMAKIMRTFHVTEQRVLGVAEQFNLEIVKGKGGNGDWSS